MKTPVILSITMLLSLAGCGPQKKTKQVAQRVDVFTATDIPFISNDAYVDDSDEKEVVGFFDEESGEFALSDDIDSLAMHDFVDSSDYQASAAEINWADVDEDSQELQKIYFEFNKYGVKADQQAAIAADAEQLKELVADLEDDALILIEGHACHSAGSKSYNLALSERRAKYVRDMLVSLGVNPEHVRIVGRGQDIPALVDGKAVTGDRSEQWANRRVEIRLVESA